MHHGDAGSNARRVSLEHAAAIITVLLATIVAYRDVLGPSHVLYFRDHGVVWPVRWEAIVGSVRAGAWPALTRAHPGGVPVEALFNGTYTPGALLFALGEVHVTYDWFVAFHTFILGAGAYALARELGGDARTGVLAGVVACLAGPVISLENLVVILIGAAYAPWVYLALARVLRRATWDRLALLALATGFHLQGVTPLLIVLDFAVFGWLFLRLRPERPLRTLIGLALAAALALGLAAIQLGPFLEVLEGSIRGRGYDYASRTFWALKPSELTELVAPNLLHSVREPYLYVELHGSRPYAYLVSFYFGTALSLAVAGLGALDRRRRIAVAALVVLIIAMAMGPATPVHRWLADLPLLVNSRFPAKYTWMLVPIAASLVGLGAHQLAVARRDAALLAVGIQFVLLVAGWWFVRSEDFPSLISPWTPLSEPIRGLGYKSYPALMSAHMASRLAHAAFFAGLLLVAAAVARRGVRHTGHAVVAIVAIDLAWAAGYTIVGVDAEPRMLPREVAEVVDVDRARHYFVGPLPPAAPGFDETSLGDIAREARLRGETGSIVGRRAGDDGLEGLSHSASAASFELVRRSMRRTPLVGLDILRRAGVRWVLHARPWGRSPLIERDVAYVVPGSSPQYMATIAHVPPYVNAYTDWRVLDATNAQWEDVARAYVRTSSLGAALMLRWDRRPDVAPAPPSTLCTSTATVTIDESATTQTEITADVDTPCPAIIVAMEVQAPAWTAEVNGVPADVFHVDAGYLATHVPAGRHRVRFVYEARTPYYAKVSGASLLVIGLAFWAGRRQRSR